MKTVAAASVSLLHTAPNFNGDENAFYYARVIEIPTPRWIVYDKVRLGAELPKDAESPGTRLYLADLVCAID